MYLSPPRSLSLPLSTVSLHTGVPFINKDVTYETPYAGLAFCTLISEKKVSQKAVYERLYDTNKACYFITIRPSFIQI